MLLTVVVPCYNEEAIIVTTHHRLQSVLLQATGLRSEILYVDDGSTDGTLARLKEIQNGSSAVSVISLSRNFGHQVAVTAGLENSAGDAVVVIDADLQDPPSVILEMLDRWRDGYQVVYGVRVDREGETPFKLLTARLFYRLMNRLSDTKIPVDVGDFRLMDRKVVAALLEMPERDRFLRAMVTWVGFRQSAVFYRRESRQAGQSKYPFWKMVKFATDGIFSFSFAPLRLATFTGFAALIIAAIGIVWAVVERLLTDNWVRGWTSLFVAILFLGGVQLVSLGIIGEYVGRIYGEVKKRPLYLVQERIGFDKETIQTEGTPLFGPEPETAHAAAAVEKQS